MSYVSISCEHAPELFCQAPGLPPIDPRLLQLLPPDACQLLVDPQARPVARAALWWRSTPDLAGRRVGLIGQYAATDSAAAARLLDNAAARLAAQGCQLMIGPIDGSTWMRYRFVTEPGSAPPFFLEPAHAMEGPGQFVENGFTPLAHYSSTLCTDLQWIDPRAATARDWAEAQGIRLRAINPQAAFDELRRIYRIATASFRNNLLYSPISEPQFLALYQPLLAHVQPEVTLIAERDEQALGFIFALPDLLQAQRGERLDTLVVKTIAVLPELSGQGLGALLTASCHTAAYRLGYRRAIHALMHEDNSSRRIAARYGQRLRGYSLFARELHTSAEHTRKAGG